VNDTQRIFSIYDVMDSGLQKRHGYAKACALLKLYYGTFVVEVAHFVNLPKSRLGHGKEEFSGMWSADSSAGIFLSATKFPEVYLQKKTSFRPTIFLMNGYISRI